MTASSADLATAFERCLAARGLSRADVEVAMIWAQTTHRVIGDGQGMPWFLPEDLAFFKDSTMGYPVVMGRISWEALEDPYRPLPGRENWVVTRDTDYSAPGGHVSVSLPDAIADAAVHVRSSIQAGADVTPTVWILGGGQVYEQCLPIADRIVITEIDMTAPASHQVTAPVIDDTVFTADRGETQHSERGRVAAGGRSDCEDGGLTYRFVTWTRLTDE